MTCYSHSFYFERLIVKKKLSHKMKILCYFLFVFIWRFYVGHILSVEEGSHPNLSHWKRPVKKMADAEAFQKTAHFQMNNLTSGCNFVPFLYINCNAMVMGHVGKNILQDRSYPCTWCFISNPSNSSVRRISSSPIR